MTKYIAIICLLAVMGGAIAAIDARSTFRLSAAADGASASGLRDYTAGSTDAAGRIYATGIVEGATKEVHLRAEQPGRVEEVLVAVGDWVAPGDVVVRLDSARQRQEVALAAARLELAEAALQRLNNGARPDEREEARAMQRAAQARLRQAEQTWLRVQQLRREQAVTQQEADDQLALVDALRSELEAADARLRLIEAPPRSDELRAAEAQVVAARAELELANIVLAKTEIRAPSGGRVLDVHIEPGELTGPDGSLPLVVMADTSTVRVRAYVEELDAPRVEVGMPARITADGLPDAHFTGQVVSISPRMASKSRYAERPGELYDTKVREVLVELLEVEAPIIGLRVDVELQTTARANLPRET